MPAAPIQRSRPKRHCPLAGAPYALCCSAKCDIMALTLNLFSIHLRPAGVAPGTGRCTRQLRRRAILVSTIMPRARQTVADTEPYREGRPKAIRDRINISGTATNARRLRHNEYLAACANPRFKFQRANSVVAVIASASEAIHRAAKKVWIASSLPLLAMTASRHAFKSRGAKRSRR
jgi:hypothetical protein